MKSASAILVALTVFTLFLESSTAPAEQNVIFKVVDAITKIGGVVNITYEDKQTIYERMESTEAAVPRAKKIAADAIPEATGTEKFTLVALYNFLAVLEPVVLVLHDEIRAAIASGSVIHIKANVIQINAAVAIVETSMDVFNKGLSPGAANDGINENVNTATNNAIFCRDILMKYL